MGLGNTCIIFCPGAASGTFADILFFVTSQYSGSIKTVSAINPIFLVKISPLVLLSTTIVFSSMAFLNLSATGNSKKSTELCEVV